MTREPIPERLKITLADREAERLGYWFDAPAANRVREFFRRFVLHTTGRFAGQPFELLDWQWEGIIEPLFGWKHPDPARDTNGEVLRDQRGEVVYPRRFTKAYLSTPKKNGKSTLLAALAAYFLIADSETAAEVYSAAADIGQAGIIYREAAKMVRKSPHLAAYLRCKDSVKTIVGPGGGFYKALSAESNTKEGLNAHAILFDELHAQPGRDLWDCLVYAGSARTQPLLLSITTAGGDLETICGEQYRYAKNILDGHNADDVSFFAYISEAGIKDDWTKEETWKKANPSYGITIEAQRFKNDYLEARDSPAKENSFRRYRLNQWVQTADAWLSVDQWDACKQDIDLADYAGRECFAGLDLSATDDTTALVLLFPEEDDALTLFPFFWLPEANILALERKHKVNYSAWAKTGNFTLTPGNVVDYAKVREQVRALAGQFKIRELSIDRKFQGQAVETDLINDGLTVAPAGQGWISQDLPAKELEKRLKAGTIRHAGHPVFRWHASNVCVDIDKNGNYTINKKKSRSKIDGIAATLMAIFAWQQAGGAVGRQSEAYANDNPTVLVV